MLDDALYMVLVFLNQLLFTVIGSVPSCPYFGWLVLSYFPQMAGNFVLPAGEQSKISFYSCLVYQFMSKHDGRTNVEWMEGKGRGRLERRSIQNKKVKRITKIQISFSAFFCVPS